MAMRLFDQVWSRIVKVVAFGLGVWIMYHEAFQDNSERPYIYAAAIAMMGLQVAETIEKIAETMGVILAEISRHRAKPIGTHSQDTHSSHEPGEHK